MKRIEILVPYVSTSQYGELYAGDTIMNCNADLADHLVNEARAARYLPDVAKAEAKVDPKIDKNDKRKG